MPECVDGLMTEVCSVLRTRFIPLLGDYFCKNSSYSDELLVTSGKSSLKLGSVR